MGRRSPSQSFEPGSGPRRVHRRRLREFPDKDFSATPATKLAWWVLSNAVFRSWWLPRSARPAMLRAFGARVGQRVEIREQVYIHFPWNLSIGDDVWIGRGVEIYNHAQVSIESDVCISQQCILSSSGHDPNSTSLRYRHRPVSVAGGTWLTSRCIVLPGSFGDPDETVLPNTVVRPERNESLAQDSRGQLRGRVLRSTPAEQALPPLPISQGLK
jgi:putative colanic acid biosynthesis acetyltransferase WcaF